MVESQFCYDGVIPTIPGVGSVQLQVLLLEFSVLLEGHLLLLEVGDGKPWVWIVRVTGLVGRHLGTWGCRTTALLAWMVLESWPWWSHGGRRCQPLILIAFASLSFFLSFFFFFFFFWLRHVTRGILVPWPWTEPRPRQWKRWVLTTGPPGNSLNQRPQPPGHGPDWYRSLDC